MYELQTPISLVCTDKTPFYFGSKAYIDFEGR